MKLWLLISRIFVRPMRNKRLNAALYSFYLYAAGALFAIWWNRSIGSWHGQLVSIPISRDQFLKELPVYISISIGAGLIGAAIGYYAYSSKSK